MNRNRDAYGAELLAAYENPEAVFEIVERSDRFISAAPWPARYYSEFSCWSRREKQAMKLVRGRVLDVGCGAGRFGLYLQNRNFDVTGIDNSPGAIQVCKHRGLMKALVLSISEIKRFKKNSFDTVLMMGNNFGLLGSRSQAQSQLTQFARITSANARIIAEAMDPYRTRVRAHLEYQRANRKSGRMSGQIRIRVRHENVVGAWFDYLLVSRTEMEGLVSGTPWKIDQIIPDQGPGYTAILIKRLQ